MVHPISVNEVLTTESKRYTYFRCVERFWY